MLDLKTLKKSPLLTERLEVRLDQDTHIMLKQMSEETGVSIGTLVRGAVEVVYGEEKKSVS